MGKFLRRLKFYAVGLGIGTIFTFMIFGNRGCSWLPDNRVKNMIADYQSNPRQASVQIEVTSTPSLKERGRAIYERMAAHNEAASREQEFKSLMEARAAQAAAIRQRKANGMNLVRRSDRWITPMDNQDF